MTFASGNFNTWVYTLCIDKYLINSMSFHTVKFNSSSRALVFDDWLTEVKCAKFNTKSVIIWRWHVLLRRNTRSSYDKKTYIAISMPTFLSKIDRSVKKCSVALFWGKIRKHRPLKALDYGLKRNIGLLNKYICDIGTSSGIERRFFKVSLSKPKPFNVLKWNTLLTSQLKCKQQA